MSTLPRITPSHMQAFVEMSLSWRIHFLMILAQYDMHKVLFNQQLRRMVFGIPGAGHRNVTNTWAESVVLIYAEQDVRLDAVRLRYQLNLSLRGNLHLIL
mmetsp:Transcript_46962/g.75009  ORF Transcript_46962/g.75009 Transcript_46962/m.75009 type:complete len:100 (-) Transcript_46962:44-343(-)